jgi:hypothetical protein
MKITVIGVISKDLIMDLLIQELKFCIGIIILVNVVKIKERILN